ncbi:MAG: ComEC/Rec2 family competence protein, partial [Actinobacteria bacterium]|nr:ComEC/Rec2 family competence protein [Actinomycetota bacterium]
MRRSYWIALDNHYILWVASFGMGLSMGKFFPINHQISSFIYFLITGSILLASLAGPVYLFRNNTIPCVDIPDVKILLTVVLIPVLTMMVMGYLITESSAERPGTDLLYMIEGDAGSDSGIITASGRVSSHPVIKYGSLYFEMTIKNIGYKAKAAESMMAGGRVFIKGTNEKINIIIKRSDDLIIKRDDFIEVKGETGTSEGGSYIKATTGNIKFTGADDFTEKIFEFRKTFYNCINRTFYKYLSYRYAPIAEALILGNRTHIPGRLQDNFEQSGTAHLMAISGMHISFLVLILFIILGRSRSGLAAAAFIIILLAAYNFMLGVKASVLRASIWMIAAMIAGQWNRESNRPRILCISFILLLTLYPLFTRDIGFWFSFAAMSGIVFIQPVLMKTSGNIPVVKKIVN